MQVHSLNSFKGGWFIGNFEPSVLRTDAFEVCYKKHKKGEKWPKHYHAVSEEINYLIKGQMIIQKKLLRDGFIFVLEPGEIADPVFLTDCELIVVKVPSIPGDKIII